MASKDDSDIVVKYMYLTCGYANSFVFKAIIDLRISDILNKAGGQLTIDEIAARLPSKTVDLDYLERIMTIAALLGIFTEVPSESSEEGVAAGQKKICMTPLSSLMVHEDGANSLVDMSNMLLSKITVEAFMTISEAVLTGTAPFKLAHGVNVWEYGKKHPDWNKLFNKATTGHSSSVVSALIQAYRGFEGVKVLVDVGGGIGTMTTSITEAYPSIRAINFDQPHVIATAPETPGVTHIGGDMFKNVPEGDVILLKSILHDWGDKESIDVLKNCYKSLPEGGKVILVELVLPEPKVLDMAIQDIVMLAHTTTGRERTAREWIQILKASGFARVEFVPFTSGWKVIEGYKS